MKVVSIFKIPNNSSFPKQTSHGFFCRSFPKTNVEKTGGFVPAPRKTLESFQKNGFLEPQKRGKSELGAERGKNFLKSKVLGAPEIEKPFGVYSFYIQAKRKKAWQSKGQVVDLTTHGFCGFFDWRSLTTNLKFSESTEMISQDWCDFVKIRYLSLLLHEMLN